jgi:hypothetical protein
MRTKILKQKYFYAKTNQLYKKACAIRNDNGIVKTDTPEYKEYQDFVINNARYKHKRMIV